MIVHFIHSNPWLESRLGSLSCIFLDLFFRCCHPRWPASTVIDSNLFFWIYHLVFTCIETHIFITNFLLSHKIISILKFSVVYYSYSSSSLLIFNNIRHATNIIFILSLREYPVFHASYLDTLGSNMWHSQQGKVFYLPSVRSIGCLHMYRFQW